MLQFDESEALKEAVMLLLDRKYGLTRIAQVRNRVLRLPKSSRAFQGTAAPLNHLHSMALTDGNTVLNICDLAEKKYHTLWAKVDAMNAPEARLAAIRKQNAADYHERVRLSIKTEELRRGRRLTKDEATRYLEAQKKEWAKIADNVKHADAYSMLNGREMAKQQKQSIMRIVRADYEKALANPNTKKRSDIASHKPTASKLNALARKFNK